MVFDFDKVSHKLVGINVVVFLLQMFLGNWFMSNFMMVAGDIFSRPWIMFTAMFLHNGSMHLIFNMYVLVIFGPLIERKIGPKRFLLTYFISGVFASFSFGLFNILRGAPSARAVGASGAIMAVLGLVIMLLPHLKVLFFFVIPMDMRTAGIIFALIDLFGLVRGGTGIAHIAHLGGLACGVGYGYYLLKKKKNFRKGFSSRNVNTNRYSYSKKSRKIELDDDDIENFKRYGKL
ncbi:MAG: rhomboid family intramembrane serine protease [Candidatus Woesearchaeota archaeon]